MKKWISAFLAALLAFSMVACQSTGESSVEENTSIQRIFAPVVKVSKNGLATWTDLEGATEYVYRINGGKEIRTTEKSVQLELNDVIEVKCVGDNVTRRDSRWSEEAQYVPAHSFVGANRDQRANTCNIYKSDGTVVLDSIGGTKPNGDVLQEGEEYVFEFDITVGAYHNGLLLAGVDNSVISDLVWSNTTYDKRDGESADKSDLFYEVLYHPAYDIYPSYATLHRSDWSYTGEYWGMNTYGWYLNSTPAANTNGVYDTRAEGFWTVEPNWCSTLYGAHFLGTGKSSAGQMEAGYKYVRFKIKYDQFSLLSTGSVAGGEQYDTLNDTQRFNMFALVHQCINYVYFDSNQLVESSPRDYAKVTDDNGEAATGVNIYDAESGELLLGAMTDASATGSVLQTNKKYILEFDVSGSKNGAVIFTGMEDALISNATWSDKTYADRAGESAVADKIRVLGLDHANHHLASEEPLFHRIWKSADGYTGNYLRDCITNENGEVDTAYASNKSDGYMRCMTFALKSWFASGKTTKEAGKQYFRMTVEYRNFTTVTVGGVVTDKENPNYGTLAATYFNTFVYSPAGGRYLYLTASTM